MRNLVVLVVVVVKPNSIAKEFIIPVKCEIEWQG